MPGKRKIKKKREDAANKCKNKSLMGSLGKYPLFPHPPPLPSWWACPEAEVLDTSIRTGATYRGGAMPTPPPLEPSRQSAEQSRRQQFTLVLVAPVWKSQPWYPILLELLEDFPILLPLMEDLIIPTHPECASSTASTSCMAYLRQHFQGKKKNSEEGNMQSCCLHHRDRSLQNLMTHY